MATALYPTPTRLALLRAILRHEDHPQEGVFAVSQMGRAGFDSYESMVGLGDTKVSSRCEEMLRAGWISRGQPSGASFFSRRWYELTDAGREVLARHDKEN